MLKLYGQYRSRAFRVAWLCKESNIPYEHVNVTVNVDNATCKTPDYVKLNPNARVPTIDDDGHVMWESAAINLYLAEKYKSPQEKLKDTQKELEELFEAGAISWQTYQKAMRDAANQARGAAEAIKGVELAAAGSSEALARVDAFRDTVSSVNNSLAGSPEKSESLLTKIERNTRKDAADKEILFADAAFSF